MAVCRGTEEGSLHVCYVGSSKFVEIKVREADIVAILQQRCGAHYHISPCQPICGAVSE